jgi:hypothetical protein
MVVVSEALLAYWAQDLVYFLSLSAILLLFYFLFFSCFGVRVAVCFFYYFLNPPFPVA